MTDQCHFCTNNATKLCDAVLRDQKGRVIVDKNRDPRTCDLPICHLHALLKSITFDMPGSEPIDSKDLCPLHWDSDVLLSEVKT